MGEDEKAPQDPMTELAEDAAAMHEWYTSMRDAGFTERETCTIIAQTIAAQNQYRRENPS